MFSPSPLSTTSQCGANGQSGRFANRVSGVLSNCIFLPLSPPVNIGALSAITSGQGQKLRGRMDLSFDFYFSFRSPYSYLATAQVEALCQRYAMTPRMRIVLPIAIRIPGFFKTVNPLWPPYLLRDTFRVSQMHDIPYRWPRPDPIVMNMGAGEVAAEQPYIYRVSRLGVAATHAGKGFPFVRRAAHAIWSGEV